MRHTRLLLLGLLAAALLEFWLPNGGNPGTAEAAVCNETGTIAVDTTWTSSCVHVVVDGITIPPGVTLTIDPGTVVKLVNPSNLATITVQGALVAQGTTQDPIMFTSLKDDTAGGDTNGDGAASSAAPGDWNFIYLGSGSPSSGASAVFEHTTISFGGRPPSCTGPCPFAAGVITNVWASPPDEHASLGFTDSAISDSSNTGISMSTAGGVTVTNSRFVSNQGTGLNISSGTLSVTGSTFQGNRIGAWLSGSPSSVIAGNTFADNTSDGLHVWGDTIPVHNVFTNNQGYAIAADQPFWTQRSSPLFQGNTASGNRFDAILLNLVNEPTVTTETNTLAANPTMPYVVNSLTIPFGATLTLEAGTILKLENTTNLPTIAVQGSLVAPGTAQEPIILTSTRDDSVGGDTNGDGGSSSPLAGDWTFIFLYSGDSSVGASATFDHASVRYGGRPVSCIGPCPVPQGLVTNLVLNPFGDPPTTDPHASLSFTNGTLSDAANTGINIFGGSASAAVSQSRLLTGTSVAVAAEGGAAVDARNNWWGDASGPGAADSSCSAATGSGSKVGCGVLFDPWLTTDPGAMPTPTPTPTPTPSPTPTPTPSDPELQLAQRFAPVLWIGSEDYEPEEVQIMLNEESRPNRTTILDRPGRRPDIPYPTAETLADNPEKRNFIDIAGINVGQEDSYRELYNDHLKDQYVPVTYAEVNRQGNRIIVDYWLFYFYDDFFGFDHEGDWERIRVIFRAASAEEALAKDPIGVRYSQHICDEPEPTSLIYRLSPFQPWDEEEIDIVDETHPVAYVALGSHANYFDNGSLGFHILEGGCTLVDHTFDDQKFVTPTVDLIDCDSQPSGQEWLRYHGHWGGRQDGGKQGPCR